MPKILVIPNKDRHRPDRSPFRRAEEGHCRTGGSGTQLCSGVLTPRRARSRASISILPQRGQQEARRAKKPQEPAATREEAPESRLRSRPAAKGGERPAARSNRLPRPRQPAPRLPRAEAPEKPTRARSAVDTRAANVNIDKYNEKYDAVGRQKVRPRTTTW